MIDEIVTTKTTVSLEPGRELDALVAERIFGWAWIVDMLVPPEDDVRRYWGSGWDEEGRPDYLPAFSTDLTAAWQVWEKLPKPRRLHETGASVVVMCGGRSFAPDSDFIHDAIGVGETAAHAICLAALKVVEAKTQ